MSSTKQTTLAGFFGKPKAGPAPPRPSSAASQNAVPRSGVGPLATSTTQKSAPPSSSPVSTSIIKTPSSIPGSSPANINDERKKRAGSPLKQSFTIGNDDSDEELSPPPDIVPTSSKKTQVVAKSESQEEEDESMDVDPEAGPSRRRKRKVVYAESNSGSSDDETLVPSSKGELIRIQLTTTLS